MSANLGSIEATVQSWGNLLRKLSITSLSLPVSIGRSFVDGMRLVSKVVPCIECLHVRLVHVWDLRIYRRENLIGEVCHLGRRVGLGLTSSDLEVTVLLLEAEPIIESVLRYRLRIHALVLEVLLRDGGLNLHHLD